jgi:2-keto-3-deoxy-L-rhamnonate aldolase RhmA
MRALNVQWDMRGSSTRSYSYEIGGNAVYDVLFLDRRHGEKVLASGLDHDSACAVARTESERRGIGRMFLAGSQLGPAGDVIVIVDSRQVA